MIFLFALFWLLRIPKSKTDLIVDFLAKTPNEPSAQKLVAVESNKDNKSTEPETHDFDTKTDSKKELTTETSNEEEFIALESDKMDAEHQSNKRSMSTRIIPPRKKHKVEMQEMVLWTAGRDTDSMTSMNTN